MANRILSADELQIARALLDETREKLRALSGEDKELLFAYRRKLSKELTYDERTKPIARRKLKDQKWKQQRGLCAVCNEPLPEKYNVLDRLNAFDGYTPENTRLIHQKCDVAQQEAKGYA